MKPYLTASLLLIHTSLIVARKSSPNYGFYNPFPPQHDQVLYNFAPANHDSRLDQMDSGSSSSSKSRETRDLAWREFDHFMRGDEEPSCADLRKMWKLAKTLQKLGHRDREAKGSVVQVRDLSKEPAPEAPQQEVYGVLREEVATTPVPRSTQYNTLRVRDPAKEIIGLLKQRSAVRRRQKLLRQRQQEQEEVYGKVEYQPPASKPPPSYLQFLQQELYGPGSMSLASSKSDPVYGVVRHYSQPSMASSYDKVRDLVSKDRASGPEEDLLKSGEAFQIIRSQLMGNRAGRQTSGGAQKSFRRKSDSKKRRRHVSSILLWSQKKFNHSWPSLNLAQLPLRKPTGLGAQHSLTNSESLILNDHNDTSFWLAVCLICWLCLSGWYWAVCQLFVSCLRTTKQDKSLVLICWLWFATQLVDWLKKRLLHKRVTKKKRISILHSDWLFISCLKITLLFNQSRQNILSKDKETLFSK